MDVLVLLVTSLTFLLISNYVKINDKYLTFAYIVVVSILAATRNIGIPDTQEYIGFYNDLSFNVLYEIEKSYMEPGFIILSILIKAIFGYKHEIFFFLIAFINVILINLSVSNIFNQLKISQNYSEKYYKSLYPLVIYMLTYGFAYTYITLRAGLGFSIAFLAFTCALTNKRKAIFLFLFSMAFHSSVVVLILVIPLLFKQLKLNRKLIYSWLILLIPALFIGMQNYLISMFFNIVNSVPILSERFQPYINPDIIVDQRSAILRILIMIFLGFVFSKEINVNKHVNVLFVSYLIGLTLFVLFMNIAVIGRVVELFTSCMFILMTFSRIHSSDWSIDGLYVSIGTLYFIVSSFRLVT